jgi:pimeloyl-ACP methyl ester carboxylesterase
MQTCRDRHDVKPPGAPVGGNGSGALCRSIQLRASRLEWWSMRLALHLAEIVLACFRDPARAMAGAVAVMRRATRMHLRYVDAAGLRWPYLDGGCGDTIVLLHGYGADKDRFGSLTPYLRRRYRLVIPDLPGFGEHEALCHLDYGTAAQVKRLDAFVRGVGLKRFHLFGASLGGYIAALYAARFPGKVLSLGLMAPAGVTAPERSEAQQFFEQTGRNIFLYTSAEAVDALIDFLIHRPLVLPMRVKRYWAGFGRENLVWRQKIFDDLVAGGLNRLDDRAAEIQAPTLLLWGEDDRICHVSSVQVLLRLIPDCRAFVFQSCGHIPLVEYPGQCRALYGRFVESVALDPARVRLRRKR